MVVLDFMSIVRFILLFRNSLITLHVALIHQDPNVRHALTYIDGNRIYNEIVVCMKTMREFSFWIETVCLCDQQMDNIIQSFQTSELFPRLIIETTSSQHFSLFLSAVQDYILM
jgi:hypothetical protein